MGLMDTVGFGDRVRDPGVPAVKLEFIEVRRAELSNKARALYCT